MLGTFGKSRLNPRERPPIRLVLDLAGALVATSPGYSTNQALTSVWFRAVFDENIFGLSDVS